MEAKKAYRDVLVREPRREGTLNNVSLAALYANQLALTCEARSQAHQDVNMALAVNRRSTKAREILARFHE